MEILRKLVLFFQSTTSAYFYIPNRESHFFTIIFNRIRTQKDKILLNTLNILFQAVLAKRITSFVLHNPIGIYAIYTRQCLGNIYASRIHGYSGRTETYTLTLKWCPNDVKMTKRTHFSIRSFPWHFISLIWRHRNFLLGESFWIAVESRNFCMWGQHVPCCRYLCAIVRR